MRFRVVQKKRPQQQRKRVVSHLESAVVKVRSVQVHRWHDTGAKQTLLFVLVPDESSLTPLQRDALNAATNLIEKALS